MSTPLRHAAIATFEACLLAAFAGVAASYVLDVDTLASVACASSGQALLILVKAAAGKAFSSMPKTFGTNALEAICIVGVSLGLTLYVVSVITSGSESPMNFDMGIAVLQLAFLITCVILHIPAIENDFRFPRTT